MFMLRKLAAPIVLIAALVGPAKADEVTDALDQARKAYQAGDFAAAKQSADLAAQLLGQKSAEGFAALLPAALSGWTAGKIETTALGNTAFGVTAASRTYTGPNGKTVQVQISGDSAMLTQFASLLNNPQIAGVLGKIITVGNQHAVQTKEGDVHIVVANKFLVSVTGSGPAEAKLAYAQAVDIAKLAKM
ncbi:MAG TPA: hypothetical protein VEK73_19915 [Xanthobacteraceae bacterium]|nr:hypothetical protein [Xanthobacteraceae bacterium]